MSYKLQPSYNMIVDELETDAAIRSRQTGRYAAVVWLDDAELFTVLEAAQPIWSVQEGSHSMVVIRQYRNGESFDIEVEVS